MTAPTCPYCGETAKRVTGEVIYPHRRDLHDREFFQCAPCEAYVGTHRRTGEPLGFPAKADLRSARSVLHHRRLDPIWQEAWRVYDQNASPDDKRRLRQIARRRVYAYLAHAMGIERDDAHTAKFDLDQCRAAWSALNGVTYADVRKWWKERKPKRSAKEAA